MNVVGRRVSPCKQTHESYFVRKTAYNARAREWPRVGCAWSDTHNRAGTILFSGPTPKCVLSPMFGSAGQREKPRTADDKQPIF